MDFKFGKFSFGFYPVWKMPVWKLYRLANVRAQLKFVVFYHYFYYQIDQIIKLIFQSSHRKKVFGKGKKSKLKRSIEANLGNLKENIQLIRKYVLTKGGKFSKFKF